MNTCCLLAPGTLDAFANLDAIVVRADHRRSLAVDAISFARKELRNRAVLVHTGWGGHWNTDSFFSNHPYLSAVPPKVKGVGTFPVRAMAAFPT